MSDLGRESKFPSQIRSRVRDVDDNEYINYGLAWGPLILGHRHPKLVEALCGQVTRPRFYGARQELEYLVAEKIQEIVPCAERVTFTSSGSEAVQLALRLACTGRNLVLKFEGHYHGWMYVSIVHTERDVAETVDALDRVFEQIA